MNCDISHYLDSEESLIALPHCNAINNYPHEIIVQVCEHIGGQVQKFLNTQEVPKLISLGNGRIKNLGCYYAQNSKEGITLNVFDFNPGKTIQEMPISESVSGLQLRVSNEEYNFCHLRLAEIYAFREDYVSEFSGISNWSKRRKINKARDLDI